MPESMMSVERPSRTASLLARMGHSLRSFVTAPKPLSMITLQDRIFNDYGPTLAGVSVTAHTAFMCSAFWDGVNQISSDVAKIPLNLMKRTQGGGSEPYVASRVYRMLKYSPNPEMRSMVVRRTITAWALVYGNGYAEIERDGFDDPVNLWPLHPTRVQPYYDKDRPDGARRFPLRYRIDGGKAELLPADIIHIQGLGCDGVAGYNVVDFAREALGLALASEKFAAAFFGNGTRFGGVLSSDQDLDEAQKEDIRKSIERMHAAADKAFRILVLEAGMKFDSSGTKPSDAEMSKIRDMQVIEIARFLNMPPHKLKQLERATFSNIEQQDLEYYKGPIMNWATLWEEELNAKLISPLEQRQQFIKHNVNAFLRGDTAARTAFYSALLDRGVYNADMVLALEDMNPQPDGQGKLFLVQGAMVPKSKLETLVDAQIEKAKQPTAAPIPPADKSGDTVESDVLREQLEASEQATAVALSTAQAERDARVSLEATGQATAAELEARRESETRSLALAERMSILTDELRQQVERADADTREAAVRRTAEEAARLAAETRADEAVASALEASAARAVAEQAATAAHVETDEARAEAEGALRAADAARVRAGAETAASDERRVAAERDAQAALEAANAATAESVRLQAELVEAGIREQLALAGRAAAEALAAEVSASVTAERAARADIEARAAALDGERARLEHALSAAIEQERISALAITAQNEAHRAIQEAARRTQVEAETAARTAVDAANTESARACAEAERLAGDVALAGERVAEASAALAAAEARQVEADAARAADAVARATAERLAEEARREAADAREALARSESVRAEALAHQATLERIAAEAEAASVRATAELRDLAGSESSRVAAVISAHRTLVVDVMRRMIERETDRARRAQSTPERLRHWLETFYDGHEDLCRTALLPAVRVHCAFIGSAEDPAEVTRRLVAAHVDESKRQILMVLDGDAEEVAASLPALLHRWDTDRAPRVADRLMTKELDYARQAR